MGKVTVVRTSPASLRADVDRIFGACAAPTLEPERPVWIKINGNFNIAYPGSNTSPWFLGALFETLKDRGFRKVSVVEGDLPEFRTEDMARSTGLESLVKRHGVSFLSYERLPRDDWELPRMLADVQLLNTPVFHTHGFAVISCATKNLFGLLPVDRRKHHLKLNEKLLQLHDLVPCVTIVDGTVGLEGESTRRGDPVRCDVLLGGSDTLSLDVIAARVMGFGPEEIPLLRLALDKRRVSLDVPLEGDFTASTLPRVPFRLELSPVRKTANWMLANGINFEWIHASTDGLRALWHRVNYAQKKRQLAAGPWQEYGQSDGAT